jgi:hypothetical protein
MRLFDQVLALLTGQRVPHALIGAAALAAHGVARSTYDIDLLTTDARVLGRGFWTALDDDGATIDIRKGDSEDPLAGVIRIETTGDRPVDIILGKHEWQTRAVELADHSPEGAPVVRRRDLVLLKLYAGGAQDLWDVRELLQLPGRDRLVAEVEADLEAQSDGMRGHWVDAQR